MAQDNIYPTWMGYQTFRCVPRTPLQNTASADERAQWHVDNANLQTKFSERRDARVAEERLAHLSGATPKFKAKTIFSKNGVRGSMYIGS